MYAKSGRHGFILLWVAIAFAKKDCTFWQSMNDCTSFTTCFWHSVTGTCNNINEWTKVTNNANSCAEQGDMFECYSYMNCFWLAHKGTCEDTSNWEFGITAMPDPNTRSCSFWDNSQDCWAIEKCYWDRRENSCKPVLGGDSGSNPSPSVTGGYPNAPVTGGYPNDEPSPPVTGGYPNAPVNGGYPNAPVNGGYPNAPVNGGYPNAPVNGGYPNAPVDGGYPNAPVNGGYPNGDTGVSTTTEPSMPPTTFWEPMNLCESLRDRKSCAYGDGCSWDVNRRRCVYIDGDCNALSTEGLCLQNDECVWDADLLECQSPCASMTEESKCAYSQECFWDEGECLATNVRCDRLSTPTFCSHNDQCYWNMGNDMCESFYTSCEEMDTEQNCGINDHCLWNDVEQECETLIHHSNTPRIINCEDIRDIEICNISNSTEHNMPCEWDKRQDKCVEFSFDCEDFETPATCNEAKFRDIECYWKGECDQRKLTHAPVKHLQRMRYLRKEQEPSSATSAKMIYVVVFLATTILGLSCGCLLFFCWKTPISEDLSEPLDMKQPTYPML